MSPAMPNHPMLKQRAFTIKAPPLMEFVKTFSHLVQNGELCVIGYGAPRYGKTTARRYIEAALTASKKMVVVSALIQLDVKGADSRSRLWRDLLRGKDQRANLLSTSPYDTLFNKLCVESDALGTDKVLIVLDEAQNLSLDKLGGLKKLVDDLIDESLSPTILMMAQPEIRMRPERLRVYHFEDLIDRFFTRMYRFRGLLPDELVVALRHYDVAEWPEGSGTTYTAHFLPKLWQEGWRLERQALHFKSAFSNLNKSLATGTIEVGMKYLTSSVLALFNSLQASPLAGESLVDRIADSVSQSGLREAFTVVGNIERTATPQSRGKSVRFARADS